MNQELEKILRAFILIPFDQEFDVIFNKLIKPALEEVGYEVKRADSFLNQQNILKDIVRGIAEADLIVVDLTTLNPNVFYELGISHTMQKPIVLLSQSIEDIPFDLRSYRVIVYSTHFNEALQLPQELKKIGEEAKSGKLGFGNPVADFLPQMRGVILHPETNTKKNIMEVEGEREVEIEKEEKGIWDFVVDGEKSMTDITECMERIIKATQEIAENIQQRTIEVQKIAQSGTLGSASQVQKLAAATAIDMIEYSKKLESEQPKFRNAWESFDENISGLIQTKQILTKADKEEALKLRSSIDNLQSGIKNALKGMQEYRGAVAGMRGISRDVNRASKRTTHILDLLISDLEGANSYCTKVLSLIDEKIEKETNIL